MQSVRKTIVHWSAPAVLLAGFVFCACEAVSVESGPREKESAIASLLRPVAVAAAVTIPPSYSACTNCRIFPGSAWQGDFGGLMGISGADQKCNQDAGRPDTSRIYKAMIVDAVPTRRACTSPNCTLQSENLDWPMRPNTTYYLSNGTTSIFTTNSAGIFVFGSFSVGIGGGFTWTALNANWTTDLSRTCQNWSTNSVGQFSDDGDGSQTASNAIRNGTNIHCGNFRNTYCVEQ